MALLPALPAAASPATTPPPAQAVTINANAPASTYARITFRPAHQGVRLSRITFTGLMTGQGCERGVLTRNKKVVRQTAAVCASAGQRVTVTWQNIGYVPAGTTFQMDFTGTGSPAGVEAFKVT
jgi:hypothetical protein